MKKFVLLTMLFVLIAYQAFPQMEDIKWQKEFPASSYVFSPTEDYLAVGAGGWGVLKFDVLTGDSIGRYPEKYGDGPISLSFTADGKLLAGVSYNGRVFVWNTETGNEIIVDTFPAPLEQVALSADGKYLAVAGRSNGMALYKSPNWEKIKAWHDLPEDPKYHTKAEVTNVGFSFDSKKLIVGTSQLNIIKMFRVEDFELLKEFNGNSAVFSPTKNELVVERTKYVNTSEVRDGYDLYRFDITNEPEKYEIYGDLKISNDGKYFILSGTIGSAIVYNYNTKREEYKFMFEPMEPVGNATLSNDNRYLCFNRESIYMLDIGNKLSVGENPENILLNLFPNPTNNTLKIDYHIEETGIVNIKVNDISGSTVKQILNERIEPGDYSAMFSTERFSSGQYFVTIEINGILITKPFQVIK